MTPEELVIDLPSDEITIKPDAPAGEVVLEPSKELATPEPVADGEDPFESIKKDLETARRSAEDARREAVEAAAQLERERQARSKAETDLAQSSDQAFRSHYGRLRSEHQQIANGIQASKFELSAAKAALRTAFEAGDANALAEAQERVSRATYDLGTLENGLGGAEQAVKEAEAQWRARQAQPKPEPKAEPEVRQQTPDDWIGNVRKVFGSKPAEWLEKNKNFVTDPKLNQKLLKAADYWRDVEGKSLDSDEFTNHLNAKLLGVTMEEKPAPQVRKPAVASAPVSRGDDVFSSQNMNASKVKAPPDIVKFCQDSGLNLNKYMMSTVDMIKKGDLPKDWLDPGYNRGL